MHTARNVLVGLALAGLLSAQQATWTLAQPTTSPAARARHAMVYDSVRERVVMFGGSAGLFQPPFGDTWEWDGSSWAQITPTTSPSARSGHVMAYDSDRRKTVLFGGGSSTETWEWDGSNWTLRTPATSPPSMLGPGMVYDSVRKRTLLYGTQFNPAVPRTMWEWDGTNWTELTPSTFPTARNEVSMVFDSARNRTVLFGGYNIPPLDETWEWNGTTWALQAPTTRPPARQGANMAFDAGGQKTLLFGGVQGSNKTWEWDGAAWAEVTTATSPARRSHGAMVSDAKRGKTVLFGGDPFTAETWLFDRGAITATYSSIGAGCGSPAATLAPATGSRPLLGSTFSLVSANLPSSATTGFMTIGVASVTPVDLTPFGMGGCFLYHSYDAVLPFGMSAGAGTFSLRVPGLSSLAGARLYFQGAAGFAATNAGEALFGTQ